MPNHYKIDSDENSDYMYNIIEEVIEKVGPRAPCSDDEWKCAELLKDKLTDLGSEAHLEECYAYPRAFFGWFRLIIGIQALASIIAYIASYIPNAFQWIFAILSFSLAILATTIVYHQFLRYREFIPKFLPYKLKRSHNVVGVIKPTGEVKKRVVFGGHIDSANRFNLIQYTYQGYAYFLGGGIFTLALSLFKYFIMIIETIFRFDIDLLLKILLWLTIIGPLILAFVFLVVGRGNTLFHGAFAKLTPQAAFFVSVGVIYNLIIAIFMYQNAFNNPTIFKSSNYLVMNSIYFLLGLWFWWSKKSVPGAIDNLTAVAVCMAAAKVLNDWREKYPDLYPKNTEVVIGLFGSEEIGCRGSYEFAMAHAEEYNKIDTTCINLESLSESTVQTVYNRENTTGTDLSPEVYNLIVECCADLGIKSRLAAMPGIAGGTDAAGLVKGGLKATSLEGIRYKDYLSYYHSDRDGMNMINKERRPAEDMGTSWDTRNVRAAMENALRICLKYLEKVDNSANE